MIDNRDKSQITVSFTVDTDLALMLTALHDLLAQGNAELPDSLIFLLSPFMDVIGLRLHELWPEIEEWGEPRPWVRAMLEAWYDHHVAHRAERDERKKVA